LRRQVIIQPGKIGISFNGNKISKVFPNTQASNAGICIGWKILDINGERQPNNHEAIYQAIKKIHSIGKPTVILFQEKNDVSSLPHLGMAQTAPVRSTANDTDLNDNVPKEKNLMSQRSFIQGLQKIKDEESQVEIHWTVDQVVAWLRLDSDLRRYADIFNSRRINGKLFSTLDQDYIGNHLGVCLEFHAHKILNIAKNITDSVIFPLQSPSRSSRSSPRSSRSSPRTQRSQNARSPRTPKTQRTQRSFPKEVRIRERSNTKLLVFYSYTKQN
jgi:hypothetical protein